MTEANQTIAVSDLAVRRETFEQAARVVDKYPLLGQVSAHLRALSLAVPAVTQTDAVRDILAERLRQIEAEGWTPEHDDQHASSQIALAAAAYILNTADYSDGPQIRFMGADLWPWSDDWWKPTDPRRDLVKAGALIIAEIERIDRQSSQPAVNLGDDVDTCIACDLTFQHGDMVFDEVSGGYIHAACSGPERDGYVGEDGEPLKECEPIPEPFKYESDFSFRSSIKHNGDAA